MAISNHERVGKALELLKEGLRPFVERELKTYHGDRWASEVKEVLGDTRLSGSKNDAMQDVAVQLVLMDRTWGDVFRKTLGKAERSLVNELLDARNRWAHQNPFSGDDADRALDSVSRLLTAVSAPQADEGRQDEDGVKEAHLRRAGAWRKTQERRHAYREPGYR